MTKNLLLFGILNFGHCNFFVIWDLLFGIYLRVWDLFDPTGLFRFGFIQQYQVAQPYFSGSETYRLKNNRDSALKTPMQWGYIGQNSVFS